jgi:Icc-related predicted phosphoesterase
MRLLLSSDIHCDLEAAEALVTQARSVDVFVCAGDLGVMRRGLQSTVDVLSEIDVPAVLVAGNGESDVELSAACGIWPSAHVLHGSGCEIDGIPFWGLGGGIPITPFGSWSFDLSEEEADVLLDDAPYGCVLVTHSPPFGHVDEAGGAHLGSRSIARTVERTAARLAVCGHIHGCWTQESRLGPTRIVNAGPQGVVVEIQ